MYSASRSLAQRSVNQSSQRDKPISHLLNTVIVSLSVYFGELKGLAVFLYRLGNISFAQMRCIWWQAYIY